MKDRLTFYKFQAYGNDFLVTEEMVPEDRLPELARRLCDRHFGVGVDGLLTLRKIDDSSWFLKIINADGSEAGMSGNGGRCAASYLHLIRNYKDSRVVFDTISGEKIYRLQEKNYPRAVYESLMGLPAFLPREIPFNSDRGELQNVEDFPLEISGREKRITALSVGNPQCAIFCDELPGTEEQAEIGRLVENHPYFPEKTNVSFVQVLTPSHIRIRIWERGVGITSSSGTGSCGAAVAAIRTGRTGSKLKVETDTGSQLVEWQEGSQVVLTGEAVFVAEIGIDPLVFLS